MIDAFAGTGEMQFKASGVLSPAFVVAAILSAGIDRVDNGFGFPKDVSPVPSPAAEAIRASSFAAEHSLSYRRSFWRSGFERFGDNAATVV